MNLILLAALASIEACVWLWRMRTAVRASRWVSSGATAATAACRILFVLLGAHAAMANEPWWALALAYVLPATLATSVLPHPTPTPKGPAR